MNLRAAAGSATGIALLTVFLTWPQAVALGSTIGSHRDPYFSAWRVAWIAHALRTDPRQLFDANIFYPAPRTLAYSDATLLQGLIGAPFIWMGARPLVVYNVLLLVGIAGSGLGMFVLVRHLTKSDGGAFVAAAIFTMMPYRVEHFIHLEMQWTMWIPLAFWAVHRTMETGSWRFGVLTGVFMTLQLLSCIYYAIFLVLFVPALVLLLSVTFQPRRVMTAWTALALGAIVSILLAYPYTRPYMANAGEVGTWTPEQIQRFGTVPLSFLTAPAENWLWGWTAPRFRGNELRLYPGIVAVLLGAIGVAAGPRRVVWIYVGLGVLAAELSRGLNGALFPLLYEHLYPLQGLRAIARFAVLGFCALAVLAGFGIEYLMRRTSSRRRRWICPAAVIVLMIDYGSAPMRLERVPTETPAVYEELRRRGPGVVMELPAREPGESRGFDSRYQFWSTMHWYPLVNGYSGYFPPAYVETQKLLTAFPDGPSIARLRELNVRHIVIHENLFRPEEAHDLMTRVAARPELIPRGRFSDWLGQAQLLELATFPPGAAANPPFGQR